MFVFPEYGLTGGMNTNETQRSSVYHYIERATEPNSPESCMGCEVVIIGSETVQRVGCLARTFDMYVVVNLIEEIPCNTTINCPADGHFQYNTNMVFNRTGCLIAKYHKYSMYMEEQVRLDHPATPEFVYFDTEYGRFGTETCFDLISHDPGITLVEKYNIDTLLFPTDWGIFPGDMEVISDVLVMATSWARRHAVNFLAANIHSVTEKTSGSAIVTPTKVAVAHLDVQSPYGKLLIAQIPTKVQHLRKQNLIPQHKNSLVHIDSNEYVEPNNLSSYAYVRLTKLQGKAHVCKGEICCSVEYSRNGSPDELYYLSAYVAIPSSYIPYTAKFCMVHRCASSNFSSCLLFEPSVADSMFDKFVLRGRFQEEYVYPAVTGSGHVYTGMEFDFKQPGHIAELRAKNFTSPLLTAFLLTWRL